MFLIFLEMEPHARHVKKKKLVPHLYSWLCLINLFPHINLIKLWPRCLFQSELVPQFSKTMQQMNVVFFLTSTFNKNIKNIISSIV